MKSFEFDSLSVNIPFVNINFKLNGNLEKQIANEIFIRSGDKRFLTSWQCCINCTKYAIDSVVEYRKFLLEQKVKLSKIKQSQLIKIVAYLLQEIKIFLSLSERCDIRQDQKYLSGQLEILRNNILTALNKFCSDTKIDYPDDLFRMIKQ